MKIRSICCTHHTTMNFYNELVTQCIFLGVIPNLSMLHPIIVIFVIFMASAYFFNLISIIPFNLLNSRSNTDSIPTAEIVHSSESMKVPTSVGKFVILIPNESHQDWSDEKFKLNTDKNSYYLHTILIVPNGTVIAFLHADAPWDTPNPHTIELQDCTGSCI